MNNIKIHIHIAFVILLLCAFCAKALALQPPKMQCLKLVDNNQKIHFRWSNDSNNDCDKFEVYYFYVNYQLCDSLRIPYSSSYNYNFCNYDGAFVNNIPQSDTYLCYIVAVDSSGNRYNSDTLRSINLDVTPLDGDTKALLEWEAPFTSADASWGSEFKLYKKRTYEPEFPIQPFATVSNNTFYYVDTSDVCSDYVQYQVGITNYFSANENCPFMTTTAQVFQTDSTSPKTSPLLDSVTVTPTNEIMLGFHESEPNMRGFVIYYDSAGLWVRLDTVYNALFWIDADANPSGATRKYRIAALDSCYNGSPMNMEPQCNMQLQLSSTDVCSGSAIVSWTPYNNMPEGLDHYDIYYSFDQGQNWTLAGNTTGLTFMLNNLVLNTSYLVFVRAVNTSGTITSSSNRINIKIQAGMSDDFSYVRSVSVIDNRYIRIKVLTSGDTLPFISLTLQRSSDGTDFTDIATLPYIQGSADYVFYDSAVNFMRNTYYYRTYLNDHCGNDVAYSNVSHNILLTGESMTQSNMLQWPQYGEWNGDVANYRVLRKLEAEDGFESISTTSPSTTNSYQDDVSFLAETGSKFTYFVEAEENINEFGFKESSCSNYLVLNQEPTLFVPNAFRPTNTINNVFIPVSSFLSADGYKFFIYTRTGECIFISTNPQVGWDGRIAGDLAPVGVYVYLIQYKLPDNTLMERTGTVTLVR